MAIPDVGAFSNPWEKDSLNRTLLHCKKTCYTRKPDFDCCWHLRSWGNWKQIYYTECEMQDQWTENYSII